MKLVLRFAVSAVLLTFASFGFGCYAPAQPSSSSASIVGRWRSLQTSKGGLGPAYELRSDGTIDSSFGAIVEAPWRVENNQLVWPPDTVGGVEQKYTLQWFSDSKVGLKSEGGVIELTRVGERSHTDKPIVGEWIERREMAGHTLEAHWLFYSNGNALFLMPMAIQHGSYTVSGSVLHVTTPDGIKEVRFKVTDGVMTLSDKEGGQEFRYAHY